MVVSASNVISSRNPETGIISWQKVDSGFSVRFIQLLPDFVRATYSARGLPNTVVEEIASYCIFGTIIRNESQHPVIYHVADWYYETVDDVKSPIKTKTDWVKEWRELGVAFRWSILPDNQRLEVGDWNQGFTTLQVAQGSDVDITYSWLSQNKLYQSKINGLRCANNDQ